MSEHMQRQIDRLKKKLLGLIAVVEETVRKAVEAAERRDARLAREVIDGDKIIDEAEHCGSNTVVVSLNRGVMPAEMFMHQVKRFGAEVLPALQAHQVKEVPLE